MKKIIFITAFICLFNATGYADKNKIERDPNLFIDSYHYGLGGKDCSEIYRIFGTSKWTFNSKDPGDLDQIYEGCKAGEKDWIKGKEELDKIKKKNKTPLQERHGSDTK